MRLPAHALALGLLVLPLASACSSRGTSSVLLVTLDTTRADALGAYGRSPSVTPNLDRLAEEGIVFERAYTVAPLTLPAHASMLTGLFPPRHGVRDNGLAPLPQAATTLAERAREAGFQTAAFLGSVVLDEGFGLEQGFERYEAPARRFYGGPSVGYAERSASEAAALAVEWLDARDRERPFLLWAHFWDPHAPYRPTAQAKARAGGDDYLGEVHACDQALGKLLAKLRDEGLDDSTLVIVVADHGEAFGEHGEVSHGPFVWDTTLHVPLLLRLPGGARGGTREDAVASVADVFPTALEAMGLAAREALDGRSLLGRRRDRSRGTYFESYYGHFNFGWHPLSGWRDGDGKLVHGPRPRYYEPAQDPGEEHDLAAERPARVAALRKALAAVADAPALARDAEGVDAELKRSLQAVGYAAFASAGTRVPGPLDVLPLPDPHDRVDELARFQAAAGHLAAERYREAEAGLRALVAECPENHFAWDRLALVLMRQNRHREALAALERVLAASPNADTWNYVGACQLVLGDEEQALAAFTHALELDPNHVQALAGIVHLIESAGLAAEAAPLQRRFRAVQSRP